MRKRLLYFPNPLTTIEANFPPILARPALVAVSGVANKTVTRRALSPLSGKGRADKLSYLSLVVPVVWYKYLGSGGVV